MLTFTTFYALYSSCCFKLFWDGFLFTQSIYFTVSLTEGLLFVNVFILPSFTKDVTLRMEIQVGKCFLLVHKDILPPLLPGSCQSVTPVKVTCLFKSGYFLSFFVFLYLHYCVLVSW